MDFRDDPATWNIPDQFMFGPAILVNPVTEAKATSRNIYLPKNTTWYDFWTGQQTQGGVHLEAAAPLDRIPLYVRAGSILPLGPPEQYTGEKPNGPIELRIYPGADGNFTLYQDEGDNYNYEKGAHSTIPITWSQSSNTLTIGQRQGTYPGMPTNITFNIVWVKPDHGTAATEQPPDKTITYQGSQLTIEP
jgi:alpha-D-xyloside xylohydrolase